MLKLDFLPQIAQLLKRLAGRLEREPGPDEVWCAVVRGPCWKHRCHQYIRIDGAHPQTGAPMSEHDCAIKFGPIMSVEVARQVSHLSASVDSARNAEVSAVDQLRNAIVSRAVANLNPRLINGGDDAGQG